MKTSETHILFSRKFNVMATFPDTEDGTKDANNFMVVNDGASVLEVIAGRIILADKSDAGTPVY